MSFYDYQSLEPGLPPAPILPAHMTPPDWGDSSETFEAEAFLDTGSDCTLVPLEALSMLQLRIVETDVPINGVGGGQVQGVACYINLHLGNFVFKAVRAYGCPGYQLNQRLLVGRDVLNRCRIEFDGPNLRLRFIPGST